MLLKSLKLTNFCFFMLLVLCVIQFEFAASYKTEIEITPASTEESTTKKSGFFGGIKKWFGGSSQTTGDPLLEATTAKPGNSLPAQNSKAPTSVSNNQKPPPLVISNAPMVPLGPRPDTPLSSPFGAGQPQWPQENTHNVAVTSTTAASSGSFVGKHQSPTQTPQQHAVGGVSSFTTTLKPSHQKNANNVQNNLSRTGGQQNLPSGFAPYQPPKSQPSGFDLSYGGSFNGAARPHHGGNSGFGLAHTTSSTSTTTTTHRPQQLDFDLRGGFDPKKPGALPDKEKLPTSPASTRPIKEDFPPLPTPKTISSSPSTPSSPSLPSPWNKPKPSVVPSGEVVTSTITRTPPKAPIAGTNTAANGGVSFVPNVGTTTIRPGFENQGNSLATDDEIRSLTETLYNKELNSQLNLVNINIQGKTRSIDSTDEAPQPLLDVDAKVFDSPTIAKMRLLFNNYEIDTQVNEHVTPMERNEENDFVDAVMTTNVMRQAMLFLQNKGVVTPDPKTHRDLVKELWFTQYSRGNGKIGSSGFEHVFVNEVKNGTIIGLHNWVYFYDEEKSGHLDYKGYLNTLDLGTKGKVLKVRFTHNGLNKPVNTLFIGTSPELELALYTVCFKLRPDRTCPVSLGNSRFGIVTYSWRYRGKSLIGSAYPEI